VGTHYQGTVGEIRALNAYIKLMRCAESVTARLNQLAAGAGLTLSQLGALEALLHLGPMCQRELGDKLLKTSGNVTMVVDNLEKRKLVKRERRGGDRRFVTVRLTDRGRRLIARIFPRHVSGIVREMGSLTEREQQALGRLCRKLGRKRDA
jgi:MarR family 2-MHQ and catechol resistance regulon transcriptional repressor